MSMLSETPGESSCEKGDGENEEEHTKMMTTTTTLIIIIMPKSHKTVLTRICNVMYSTSLYSMLLPYIMVPGLLWLWLTLLRFNSF